MDIYRTCPALESEKFLFRLVQDEDCNDLLKVYSDKNALPFFNSSDSSTNSLLETDIW